MRCFRFVLFSPPSPGRVCAGGKEHGGDVSLGRMRNRGAARAERSERVRRGVSFFCPLLKYLIHSSSYTINKFWIAYLFIFLKIIHFTHAQAERESTLYLLSPALSLLSMVQYLSTSPPSLSLLSTHLVYAAVLRAGGGTQSKKRPVYSAGYQMNGIMAYMPLG